MHASENNSKLTSNLSWKFSKLEIVKRYRRLFSFLFITRMHLNLWTARKMRWKIGIGVIAEPGWSNRDQDAIDIFNNYGVSLPMWGTDNLCCGRTFCFYIQAVLLKCNCKFTWIEPVFETSCSFSYKFSHCSRVIKEWLKYVLSPSYLV